MKTITLRKYLIFGFLFSCFCMPTIAQSLKSVRDEPLRAQDRRDVYIRWGDWKPKGSYFLGIQTDPNHEMVWGWTAPLFGGNKTRNKNYQKQDIRPLIATGKQNLRYLAFNQQKKMLDNMKKESDEMGQEALNEVMYYSSATSSADPLYLLYFKKTLKPVYDFKVADVVSQVKDAKVYDFLKKSGLVDEHIKSMEILKDRFKIAMNSDMERGQRIIFYHKILEDYRRENNKFNRHIRTTSTYLKFKDSNDKYNTVTKEPKSFENWENRDEENTREVLARMQYNLNQ